MENKELVSIIMPTFNCAEYIGETIKSVIEQTYENWELIIVDDKSTDDTKTVVTSFKDKRIKYVQLHKNSGAAVARNRAMALARGSYLAFLDSDDLWTPDKLVKQLRFMKQNDYNITATAYEQIDESGKHLGRVIRPKIKVGYNGVLLSCPVGNSTVMYNRDRLGKFKVPNIRKRNDDALWLQMLKKEKYIYGLNDVLMLYRIRQNSVSHNKISLIKYHWQLYRKIEHLSIPRSCFHIVAWVFIKVFKIK